MATSTLPAAPRQRKPRPAPARSIRLLVRPSPECSGVVRIAVGQSATDYLLQPMRSDFGRAFRLVKLLGDHDGYNVCLNSRFSLCDCRGFHSAKSGECKHVAGLKALVAAGKL